MPANQSNKPRLLWFWQDELAYWRFVYYHRDILDVEGYRLIRNRILDLTRHFRAANDQPGLPRF